MKFDQFAAYCSVDVEHLRHKFYVTMSPGPVIHRESVGFIFKLDTNEDVADFQQLMHTFVPLSIESGNRSMFDKLLSMGRTSRVNPYFENNGFFVVLQSPVERRNRTNVPRRSSETGAI